MITRAIVVVLLAVVLCTSAHAELTSPAFDHIQMNHAEYVEVEKEAARWMNMECYAVMMNYIALYKPQIDEICTRKGIEPFLLYGLFLVESKGDPVIVDGLFRAMIANKAHVGLGQLNSSKTKMKNKAEVIRVANTWRKFDRAVTRMARKIKRGKMKPTNEYYRLCAQADTLKRRWEELDPRFGVYTNLKKTIEYFVYNYRMSGDYTLAIMAHHGGTNSPIRQAAYYLYGSAGEINESKAALYLQSHETSYFFLRRWELKKENRRYWAKKADGHLYYCRIVLGASEAFWRYSYHGQKPKAAAGYEGEVNFKVARHIEHTGYFTDVKYHTVSDLIRAAKISEIVPAPEKLSSYGVKVACDIGKRDPKHQRYYQMASPAIWGVLCELGSRASEKWPKRRQYRVDSLTRCADYLPFGSKTTSHNSGGAVDIDLNRSFLSLKELTVLHHVLYEMAQEGKILYYVESDTVKGGYFETFKVPYNFRKGGQAHIVINPAKSRYFACIYGNDKPQMICKNKPLIGATKEDTEIMLSGLTSVEGIKAFFLSTVHHTIWAVIGIAVFVVGFLLVVALCVGIRHMAPPVWEGLRTYARWNRDVAFPFLWINGKILWKQAFKVKSRGSSTQSVTSR